MNSWNNHDIYNQLIAFLVKYISIPALIAIVIKITLQVRKRVATVIGVTSSLIVGLGSAYLFSGILDSVTENEGLRTIAIAFVAIASDKIAEYIIFDMEVDGRMAEVGDILVKWLKKLLGVD